MVLRRFDAGIISSALFQFLLQLSTWNAEFDGAEEVFLGEVFVVFVKVEVGTGEEEVGVVGFEFDGFVEVEESEFGLVGFGFNFGTDGVKFGSVGVLVDEEGEAGDGFLRFVGILEEDGYSELGGIVVGGEGEQTFVVMLGILIVAALLVEVGAVEEGSGVVGGDVENFGVPVQGFALVAQAHVEVGLRLEDGNVFGGNTEGKVITFEGFEGFAFCLLNVGDVRVDKGIADVVGGEFEGLAKEGDGFVVAVVLSRREALLDVLLIGGYGLGC